MSNISKMFKNHFVPKKHLQMITFPSFLQLRIPKIRQVVEPSSTNHWVWAWAGLHSIPWQKWCKNGELPTPTTHPPLLFRPSLLLAMTGLQLSLDWAWFALDSIVMSRIESDEAEDWGLRADDGWKNPFFGWHHLKSKSIHAKLSLQQPSEDESHSYKFGADRPSVVW